MRFNDKITVYKLNNDDSYNKLIYSGYKQVTLSATAADKQEDGKGTVKLILDNTSADINCGDILYLGVGEDITSRSQLDEYYTVTAVKVYNFGTRLDNMIIEAN